MKPKFPTNYDELVQDLLSDGSISFEIKIENKEKLQKALNRCRRHKSLWPQPDSFLGRLNWLFYGLYSTLLTEIAFRNDREGNSAINYFNVASDYISSIEGRDVDDSTTEVTYVART